MNKKLNNLFLLFLLIGTLSVWGEVEHGNDKSPQSVGLVLSGGGAKGIAEIGVIQALEDNDIPIDYITGTSMGAIVGGLYASGYTPDEMMHLILSPGFASWSTGKIDPALVDYFSQGENLPEWVKIDLLSKSDSTRSILPSSLISPLPMNFAFMELFASYTAQCGGDFNNLFVPFRCVTSDVYAKHKVVLSKGDLGDAIRASMSFPTVFQPIEIDSFLAFDGGIYDNFPVDVMVEDFKPDIILGVDVSGPNTRPPQYDLFQQLEDMIMQKSDYNVPPEEGIRIKIDTEGIELLNFPEARSIYDRGYRKAMEMIDSIKGRVTSRISKTDRTNRRNKFKAATPKVVFDHVSVTGGTPEENDYIQYIFTKDKPDTFDIEKAKRSYYSAVTSGKLRNLVPHAVVDSETGYFDLDLKATVRNNFDVGVGGYLTTSVNSMLFLSAGYSTFRFNRTDLNVNAWLGQSYMAATVTGRFFLKTSIPSSIDLSGVISRMRIHQDDKLFYQDREPVFITHTEGYGRLGYSWSMGQTGRMGVLAGFGYLKDSFSSTAADFTVSEKKNRVEYKLGELGIQGSFYTLNNKMFPSKGHKFYISGYGLIGNYTYQKEGDPTFFQKKNSKWLQLVVDVEKYFSLHKNFSFGFNVNVLASTRKLLEDYNASIVTAPSFNPTPSSYNSFHSSLRAMSYAALGATPIVLFSQNLQLRLTAQCFMPFREIQAGENMRAVSGQWFHDPKFFSEASIVYNLPFASLSGYVNYIDSPGDRWNVGLTFGLFFLAPQYLH